MDLTIRPATNEDHATIREIVVAAFGNEHIAKLWDDVRTSGWMLSELVAGVGGEIVGHVGLSHAWLDARRELVDVLVLSPLSTLAAHRERGIGTALVGAAISAAGETGRPALFLEGSPAYYGARGFSRARLHGFEAPSRRTPEAAFQVALLDSHQPWMTGRVIYPDVWWCHDAAGLRDPDLAQLEAHFARERPLPEQPPGQGC